ncbi:SH3 domain-containing protein, partial [Streptomyces mangrovisoli]|uniref:SH3 domain-containing protein n=1 Tax=Streptomyces mangrovisoli TaxID=1428628 RepID=UPI001F0B1BA0
PTTPRPDNNRPDNSLPGNPRPDNGRPDSGRPDNSRPTTSSSALYRGVVTANELFLRAAPNRGGQVIRVAHRGQHVSIFCRTQGENIQGNRIWYLLTDGTWAWGSARYIETIGATPRWC